MCYILVYITQSVVELQMQQQCVVGTVQGHLRACAAGAEEGG